MNPPLLTFDDGPSESTAEILDLLKRYGIQTTFFVIGYRAEQRSDLVERAASEGHVIGNHSWDHVRLAQILDDAEGEDDLAVRVGVVKQQLQRANDAIAKILGAPPTEFRAPWFSADDRVVRIANTLGLTNWGPDVVETNDYHEDYDADYVARAILDAREGQVILLHDGNGDVYGGPTNPPRPKTVEALGLALPEYASRWGRSE